MELTDLIKILHGDISHIDTVDESDMGLYSMRVIVTPVEVKKILLAYLSGELSANDLTNWAGFLCIRTEYVSPRHESNPDYYEDMWYVVQCLSTPEIDGEVSEKQVKLYLSELDKYFK
ncbi:MAG: hypothetical protein H0U71_09030 [Gammaproteobacteria bacterium]|nr:hypothetical protein [Gammaproteobacteria bacterium]